MIANLFQKLLLLGRHSRHLDTRIKLMPTTTSLVYSLQSKKNKISPLNGLANKT